MKEMENQQPEIVKSSQIESNSVHSDKSVMRKVILPIFLIIIAVEVIFGAKTLLSPIKTGLVQGARAQNLGDGKISLVSRTTNYSVGQGGTVSVRVSTGGHSTDGTDLYLQYDPAFLDVSPSIGFSKGAIYGEYPVVNIDANQGILRVSGIAPLAQGGFTGLGELGKLNFKPKKAGTTTITAKYQSGATTFSNIIETASATNLLKAPSSLTLTISAQAVPTPSSSPVCSERVLQLCRNSTGRMGTQWCTSSDDPYSCTIGCFKEQYGIEQGCRIVNDSK